jgi:hypothetical protein
MSPQPIRAVNIVDQWNGWELQPRHPDRVLSWDDGLERLDAGRLYWSIGRTAEGGSHARPVFAVVLDGLLHTTSSAGARKTALLRNDPRCTFATSTDGMDLVYEGLAREVTGRDDRERVAARYREKYGWEVQVEDDGFHAPYGAPSAGPPPYVVLAIHPVTVRGFGTDDRLAPFCTPLGLRLTDWPSRDAPEGAGQSAGSAEAALVASQSSRAWAARSSMRAVQPAISTGGATSVEISSAS